MSNCLKTREKSVYKSVRYKLDIRNATRTLDRLPTAYRSIQIDPKSTKSTNCLSSTKVKNRNPRTWAQEFQQIRHIVRHARHFTTLVRRIYAFPVADIERQSIWKLLAPIERRMIVKFVSSTAHGALIQQHAKSGSYSFSLTRFLSLSLSLSQSASRAIVAAFIDGGGDGFFSLPLFKSLRHHEVTNYWLNLLHPKPDMKRPQIY